MTRKPSPRESKSHPEVNYLPTTRNARRQILTKEDRHLAHKGNRDDDCKVDGERIKKPPTRKKREDVKVVSDCSSLRKLLAERAAETWLVPSSPPEATEFQFMDGT
jgi:hypothetical protein